MTDLAVAIEGASIQEFPVADVVAAALSRNEIELSVAVSETLVGVAADQMVLLNVGNTGGEGDPSVSAAELMAAHLADPDPHPQYVDGDDIIDGGNF